MSKQTKQYAQVFLLTILLLTVTVFGTGCLVGQPVAKKVSVDSLLHLGRGLSQEQVEKVFGTPARHEFTARSDGRLFRCVSFTFESRGRYYFVFTNDALAKVCEVTRFQFKRVPYKDTWVEYPDRSDPEKRMKASLDTQDLSKTALAESLQRRVPPTKSVSMNVLPAFIIVAPIWAVTAPLRAGQRAEIVVLARRYDPQKVTLGMSIEKVEAMFGNPIVKESTETNRELRYYGSAKLGADSLLWISVVFEGGQAVRVFSHDFFDMEKIFPKKQ